MLDGLQEWTDLISKKDNVIESLKHQLFGISCHLDDVKDPSQRQLLDVQEELKKRDKEEHILQEHKTSPAAWEFNSYM